MSDLSEAFDWQAISCPEFDEMLYYNLKTGVYKTNSGIIDKSDKRLIEFMENFKNATPVDFPITTGD